MSIRTPKDITDCREFFLCPQAPRHRQYEALRAYFVEGRESQDVARAFGYSPGAFRVLCHHFRRDPIPRFFVHELGPRTRPKKSGARDLAVSLRKQNHSVYEISAILREQKRQLSPTAVREMLREEGFAALPRRLDEERPAWIGPSVQPIADVRNFSLAPRCFPTRMGGLFLFLPDLVRLNLDRLADSAGLAGSQMIPATHALRAGLALKLWSVERKSHVMALAADAGLALFSGLNATPKKSFLSEYSGRVHHRQTVAMLAAWYEQTSSDELFSDNSFNLDFHSVPYYGEDPLVEKHYVSMRSRAQPSVLTFLAQDASGRAFCYSNADLRKGEEAEEIFKFIVFWQRVHGKKPQELVFDSRLTTQANLARLDRMQIPFITLRQRSPPLLKEIAQLPPSAFRTVELDVPLRKFRTPRVFEQKVDIEGRLLRQLYVLDLGHDKPTILLTNKLKTSTPALIVRYAQRMLIENALSDAVRFFHMDALSSSVGMKVDFDMSLMVIASGLYRLMARRMRGYGDAQARQLFRDLIDTPADIRITETTVEVKLQKRAHLPIVLASGLLDETWSIPWWGDKKLRMRT